MKWYLTMSPEEHDKFAKEYGFQHKPSSLKFLEQMVKQREQLRLSRISGISPVSYPWNFWLIDLLLSRTDTIQLSS